MMNESYYLGVDIGTTSVKAVLFNEQTKVMASHSVDYPLFTPSPLIAEQDPDAIFCAVVTVIKQTINQSQIRQDFLRFISFSSAMHSLIAVDKDGVPLTKSISWADTRSAPYADIIQDKYHGHQIYMRTGTPIHAMSPFVKLVWLKEEKGDIFKRTAKFISIKEYIFHKFFGSYLVDYSIASATGLFNVHTLKWDEEALSIAGVSEEQLSTIVPTTHVVKGMKEPFYKAMGISKELPFIIGASDGVLSNLGVNAIQPGVIALTIGTSGAIRTVTDRPKTDPKGRTFCYALTDKHWVIGGPVNNGGIIFRWLRDELAGEDTNQAIQLGVDPYDRLTDLASSVRPGSDGLIFHPFLTGERAPIWNANARGSFFGLSLHHKKEHMVRAVLEGITYNLNSVLLILEELVGEQVKIQATGGFARSAMWRQLLADVFDKQIVVPKSFESSCLGAVVLGMLALGDIRDLNFVSNMVGTVHVHEPVEKRTAIYRDILPIYQRLTKHFESEYEAIAAFQRKYVVD